MELVTEVKQRKQETQLTIKKAAVGVGNGGSAGCGVGVWGCGMGPGSDVCTKLESFIRKKN